MSLPKGWITIDYTQSFSQESTSNKKVKTKDCNDEGKFPVVDQGQEYICGYVDDQEKVIEVETPLIIFGDHTRLIKWIDFNFVPGADGTKVLKPKSLYYPRFFYYQMRNIELPDKGYSRHFKFLKEVDFVLPPLNEQKRIAKKLDELLATVESIKTRLDKAPTIIKRFRQSILAAATSGKLTEEWREENPLPSNSADQLLADIKKAREELLEKEMADGSSESKRLLSKIKKHEFNVPDKVLPQGWIWTSFMESMERVVDCHNKTAPYKESGIPLIRTTDIRNGLIKLSGAKYIDQDTYDYWSRRCPPKEGDLIFTREAPMGEVGIVPENTTLCMGQRMMLLRPMQEYILNKYMLFNIMNPNFQQDMKGSALGATVQHLRVGDVEKLIFPLCPLEEQKEIVSQVESLFALADTLEEKIEAAKVRVDKLTQSILAKAFKGELVPQDPNDEPAEKLLERIKAEQEKEKPKKTRKKK